MSSESRSSVRRGPVRRLPDGLIDQIAAGEVVERPASIAKELVENALDAGAARVRVEVRAGGRDWIAVSDDGAGMTPDDARLALERHATSKIASAADLARIGTFGFRGEALPSIASVCRMRLRTRPHAANEAWEILVEGGRVLHERSVGAPPGTRVEVAELFGSVPARRKFLKSPTTEWGHLADWLGRAALALPEVHFEVRRDDRDAIVWPAVSDPVERIAAVIGEEDAAAFVPVRLEEGDPEEGGVIVHGFATRPDRHRATMAGIHFFVNRRPVRDRLLSHALVGLYRDLLPRGRFPAAVLFLEVPHQAVDVNVHPAKWEVRFADPQAMHRRVRRAVGVALGERSWVGPAPTPAAPPAGPAPAAARSGTSDWIFAAPAPPGADPAPRPTEAVPSHAPGVRFGELRLLGQFLATYLVLETKDRLLLVDQHAAHERVLYERLRADWLERGVERQGLLAPATVSLDPGRASALAGGAAGALRLGFEIEPFGDDTVAVRAVPALLAGRDPRELVRDLADELAAGAPLDGADATRALEAADHLFASLACHAARRKGEVLDAREQQALLDALDSIPWAPTCPHGRPVVVPFELAEIERRFARR